MTQPVHAEAHKALRVAEYLRISLARDEFTPAERDNLTHLYADNVLKAVPALFRDASPEQLAAYEHCMRKILEVMLEK